MGQAPATGGTACVRLLAIFPDVPEPRKTACGCAVQKRPWRRRSLGRSPTRGLDIDDPTAVTPPAGSSSLIAAPPAGDAPRARLVKGPNIARLPRTRPAARQLASRARGRRRRLDGRDHAGRDARLPFRSSFPRSRIRVRRHRPGYVPGRAPRRRRGWHAIVAGHNYGQGSSREHAALAPRYLGLRSCWRRATRASTTRTS